jgi:hypothetical protein
MANDFQHLPGQLLFDPDPKGPAHLSAPEANAQYPVIV